MKLSIGDKAPNFRLFNTDKKEVELANYQGESVLLLFFPLAFTSVCTEELCSVSQNLSKYAALNVKILGISVDSVFTLNKYKSLEKIDFPLLSDFNKEVSRSYGALYDIFALEMREVSKRAAFIIDPKGYVQYAEVLEDASKLPNFAAINQLLRAEP